MTVIKIDRPGGVERFAKCFIEQRLKGFQKDLTVCLKIEADKKEERAFLPMLTNVIALLELFGGLYSGKLTYRNASHLFKYLSDFAPGRYDDYRVKLLYIAFRHKLAHASHPYVGFDTSKHDDLKSRKMRLGWSITAFPRAEAITITKLPRPRAPLWPTPWSIRVNHVVEISVYTLADDVIKSVPGYMKALKTRQDLRDNFRACMDEFFQA